MCKEFLHPPNNVQEILLSCGVQEEDEASDSMDFTAESIGNQV
jgi:hypothetical protein